MKIHAELNNGNREEKLKYYLMILAGDGDGDGDDKTKPPRELLRLNPLLSEML